MTLKIPTGHITSSCQKSKTMATPCLRRIFRWDFPTMGGGMKEKNEDSRIQFAALIRRAEVFPAVPVHWLFEPWQAVVGIRREHNNKRTSLPTSRN
jgi:hypothetical protein